MRFVREVHALFCFLVLRYPLDELARNTFPEGSNSMEFDSLAFSASRFAPKKENRIYCPACQEGCEPEPATSGVASDPPTCPVCEEKCVEPPPVGAPEVSKKAVLVVVNS